MEKATYVPAKSWSSKNDGSKFSGNFITLIGINLLGVLVFPVIPVLAFVGIASAGSDTIIAAIIVGILLAAICSPVPTYLMYVWTTKHSNVDGAQLAFTGNALGTLGFLIKIGLLSVITLGIYPLLGMDAVAEKKYRYRRTIREGTSVNEVKSNFTGNFVQIVGLRIAAVVLTALVLAIAGFIAPELSVWDLLKSILSEGIDGIESYISDLITTGILAALVALVGEFLVVQWCGFRMLKWEINHTVIDGYNLSFDAEFSAYLGFKAINAILSIVTLGLFILLGFNKIRYWRFRVRHTHVSVSKQINDESTIDAEHFGSTTKTLLTEHVSEHFGDLSLKVANIKNGARAVCNSAYAYCSNLKSVDIPSTVTHIGYFTFTCCSELTNITIPSSVSFIGGWAFLRCKKLEHVYFEGNAPEIGLDAFADTSANLTIHYKENSSGWSDILKGHKTVTY